MSTVLGFKKYGKNGEKETQYIHVHSDQEEAVISALSMLSSPVEGNEDLFKTTIEYANKQGGDFSSFGPTNRWNPNNLDEAPTVSKLGDFQEIENYNFGLNNEDDLDQYIKDNPDDHIVFMDYTSWNEEPLIVAGGENTTFGKQFENFKDNRPELHHDQLKIGFPSLTKEANTYEEKLSTINWFNKMLKLDTPETKTNQIFSSVASLPNSTFELSKALSSIHKDDSYKILGTTNFLKENIDIEYINEQHALEKLKNLIKNPRDKKESLFILDNGKIIKVPMVKSELDHIKEEYGFANLSDIKNNSTFIATTLNGEIINSSSTFKEPIRLNFLNNIAKGDYKPDEIINVETTFGQKQMDIHEILEFQNGFETIDINGFQIIDGGENKYLMSPAGKQLAFYKDEESDKTDFINKFNEINQILIYSINQNGGRVVEDDFEKFKELEKLTFKYGRYSNELNTEGSDNPILDDIATANQLILSETSFKIQDLAKKLNCDDYLDTSSVDTLEESMKHGSKLSEHIEMNTKSRNLQRASDINVSTNLGDFTIAHTDLKQSVRDNRLKQKQSFTTDFKPSSSSSENKLKLFAEELTKKIVEKVPQKNDSNWKVTDSDLIDIVKTLPSTSKPGWNDIIGDDITVTQNEGYEINYKNAKNVEHFNSLDNQINDGIEVYKAFKKAEDLELNIEKTRLLRLKDLDSIEKQNPYKHLLTSSRIGNITERGSGDSLLLETSKGTIIFGLNGNTDLYEKDDYSNYENKIEAGFIFNSQSNTKTQELLDKYDVPSSLVSNWGDVNINSFQLDTFKLETKTAEQFKENFKVTTEEKPYFDDIHKKIISGHSTQDEINGNLAPDGLVDIYENSVFKSFNKQKENLSTSQSQQETLK